MVHQRTNPLSLFLFLSTYRSVIWYLTHFCSAFSLNVVNIFPVAVYFLSHVNDLKIFSSEYRMVYPSHFPFVDSYVEVFSIYKMSARDRSPSLGEEFGRYII